MRYWWVNHNQAHDEELASGMVRSPKTNRDGSRNETYLNVARTSVGDVVFSYAGGEIRAVGRVNTEPIDELRSDIVGDDRTNIVRDGWRVGVEWRKLREPLIPKNHLGVIAPLLPTRNSPIRPDGRGNQGCYLTAIDSPLANLLVELISINDPELARLLPPPSPKIPAEADSGTADWPLLRRVAAEINARSPDYAIGELQTIRRSLKGHSRGNRHRIFDERAIDGDDFAFHYGGRSELQFNIGIEEVRGTTQLRHGVALSFELSQSVHSIEALIPKARRFNEFMRVHPDAFPGLRMWHYDTRNGDFRSDDRPPAPIPHDHVRDGMFVFLGRNQPVESIDYDLVLRDFDRMLDLYRFVEGTEPFPVRIEGRESSSVGSGFQFRPGCPERASSTKASIVERTIDVSLRHNDIERSLVAALVKEFGDQQVGAEQPTAARTLLDVVVRTPAGYIYYEIKTGLSCRACIRDAMGQLLEYAYWPGATEPIRFVVVGEPPLDAEADAYLATLRDRLGIQVHYEQVAPNEPDVTAQPPINCDAST